MRVEREADRLVGSAMVRRLPRGAEEILELRRDLYLLLRGEPDLEGSESETQAALDALASPLIGALIRTEQGDRPSSQRAISVRRLRLLASALQYKGSVAVGGWLARPVRRSTAQDARGQRPGEVRLIDIADELDIFDELTWQRCGQDDDTFYDQTMVPELDANRVRKWAHEKTPPEYRNEMRIEVDETPRGLTILECRPPWSELIGPEWTRNPIARLSYVKKRNEWTLYWPDRNSKFQRYWEAEPTEHVGELLEEIDADPTCIFWG